MHNLNEGIIAAFFSVPYPGDSNLIASGVMDRNNETWQLLHGKKWCDMPIKPFFLGDTPIPDLSAAAFHYYVPAMLIASLDDSLDISADIAHSLVFYLSPSRAIECDGPHYTRYDDAEGFNRRMEMLSADQRRVICKVLREYVRLGYMSEDEVEDATKCLG